ncbi:MAG: hypothetical protein ACKO13_00825 [Cytophagales bacterium]
MTKSRTMRYWLLLLMISLAGCKIDRDKKVDRNKYTFTINDDAELFFRNVRQIYYDRSSPDGTWQAYRFGGRYQGNERPAIYPVIVINWLKDEAYLLVDTNEVLSREDFLRIKIVNKKNTVQIDLKDRGRERMLEFGSALYEALQRKDSVFVWQQGKYVPILIDEEDRESVRIPMADFYRLTRVF